MSTALGFDRDRRPRAGRADLRHRAAVRYPRPAHHRHRAEEGEHLSFVLENAHPHDIGTVLDESGVAVRAGHHCAQPLMDRFGIAGTARASFGLYNGFDDVDALVDGLRRVKEIFG